MLIEALNKNVEEHPLEGFWLSYHRIRNNGNKWNHKRLFRVYQQMGLSLRRKKKKRLPARIKEPLIVPKMMNDTWSIDFTSDALVNGRKFRSFNVMDDYNREALHIDIEHSFPSRKVVCILNRLCKKLGKPKKIRMDNGPEFIAHIIKDWSSFMSINFHYIQPGKPTQNAFIERLNRTYRESVLDAFLFNDLMEVREQTEIWMEDYNNFRPHSSLGNIPPKQYLIMKKTNINKNNNQLVKQNCLL